MRRSSRLWPTAIVGMLATVIHVGCTGKENPPPDATAAAAASPAPSARTAALGTELPTASVTAESEPLNLPAPEPGTPEWLIREITERRAIPYGFVRQPLKDQPEKIGLVRVPDDKAAAVQQERLAEIMEFATQAIASTHSDKTKEQVFNNAVHYLTDARMQLALAGDAEQAQMLADDAESLYQRDQTSFAAVEAGHKLVQLAQSMAERYGQNNSEWVVAFASQARLFAEKFPQEQSRAAVSLTTAGRLCEAHNLTEQARLCYFMVAEKFPGSPFAQQIAGILRRLRLEGQPLQLAGPTIDGGFLTIDQFSGRHVLVVFWASNSEAFQRDLPRLTELSRTYPPEQLTVLGVNLDVNESAVDQFLEQTGLGWHQIFFSDGDKRGAKNPLARYYGLQSVPTYWLVNREGIVVAAPADLGAIPQLLQK